MELHTILPLTRNLFIFDTETTGVDPADSRIVEIGVEHWTSEGLQREWRTLVNPGVPIPATATAIHSINDSDFTECKTCGDPLEGHTTIEGMASCITPRPWPTFAVLAPKLATIFKDCDYAGQNVRFDLRILRAEMIRAGVEWSYTGARVIDSGRLEQLAIPRSLSDLYQKYEGAPLTGAHGALADVQASRAVISHQLEAHPQLPRDLDALHELQWPGWLTDDGKFRLVDGVPTCMFGKHNNTPVAEIPVGYLDWIIKSEFAPDVRTLAQQEKLSRADRCR